MPSMFGPKDPEDNTGKQFEDMVHGLYDEDTEEEPDDHDELSEDEQ